jgi:rare lipoprotein A (peptidoglycan hydrolase)
VALIAALALVAVPGSAGSRTPSPARPLDANVFVPVDVSSLSVGTVAAAPVPDPAYRSDGALDPASLLTEPASGRASTARAAASQPRANAGVIKIPVWHYDRQLSWYGPGFYGSGTACGQTYTRTIIGVAHRTLPCGTLVTFKWAGNVVTMPVIDRGPYVSGRQWDLSAGACAALHHCFTGPIYWKLGGPG